VRLLPILGRSPAAPRLTTARGIFSKYLTMNNDIKHICREEDDETVTDTYALFHCEALRKLTPDGVLPPFQTPAEEVEEA
jgi:hypothetical protein